ncbi:MAG: RagB/SusD family nutrient uptake outer membrane protein [Bacteroidota bacterium]
MTRILKNLNYKILGVALVLNFSSCEKFVDLGAPPTQISFDDAFKTDAAAQSTVLGIYSVASAAANGFLTVNNFYPEISGGDVQYNGADAVIQEFAANALTNNNLTVNSTWGMTYSLLKNANNAINGLNSSSTLSPAMKAQLLGEAKFFRAFCFFQLVNLYGDVPLPLKDALSAIENSMLPRSTTTQVYAQIISDLTDAQTSLPLTYVGTFRGRINKLAATSLLARVYLYLKDYTNAELQATQVITSGTYSLPSPATSFINTSNEIIWQIANLNGFSVFGTAYVTAPTVVPAYSLSEATYQQFEGTNDLRRSNWVALKTLNARTYYAITKYKLTSGAAGNEYNVVLRFAELYLIRAEARAQLNNLSGAKTDVDAIRSRAGLTGVSATLSQPQMLTAIEKERRLEFFGEWGHRWFDLKRTNRADVVLRALRPTTWKSTSVLYPIPQPQILLNPTLTQNEGYIN